MDRDSAGIARVSLRWVMTSNPFYAISAALVFGGLRLSCSVDERGYSGLVLMAGLAAYTLLLAGTALGLVRFARAWEDVRTVLLLVVLMFLALSVSFDDRLAADPARGAWWYVGGLAFALLVSEGLFLALPLRLPIGFRVPYWLFLCLFFLYPLITGFLAGRPESFELHAALLGFPVVGSLVALTLLPAVRRGAEYVMDQVVPWRWPMYPWSLFVFLGVGVMARAQYLCVSFHFIEGKAQVFGPYFLAPFVLAVAVVLYEIGRTAGHRRTMRLALCAPWLAVGLGLMGHSDAAVYRAFLAEFEGTLGAMPAYLALLGVAVFHLILIARGERSAPWAFMITLAGFAIIGPATLDRSSLIAPRGAPLALAGLVPLAIGARRRETGTCFAGVLCLAAGTAVRGWEADAFALATAAHVLVFGMLLLGIVGKDHFAAGLRKAGAWGLVVLGGLELLGGQSGVAGRWSSWVAMGPWVLAVIGFAYARVTRERAHDVAAGVNVLGWSLQQTWTGYARLRALMVGLDAIVLGLLFFVVAAAISLAKAGVLRDWWERLVRAHSAKGALEDLGEPPFG